MRPLTPRLLPAAVLIAATLSLAACASSGTEADSSSRAVASPSSGAPSAAPSGEASAPATAAYPVTVESCGRSYTYDQAPKRVVLGFPRTLETLDALGVGDSVYGYVNGATAPLPADYSASIVEVSPDYAPGREPVIAAGPDLFLGNDEGQVTSEGGVTYDDLAGVDANVYILGGYCTDATADRSLDGIYTDIANLGAIFGVPDRAEHLSAEIRDRVAAAKAKVDASPVRVGFVQAYDGKLYALSGYPASSIISALGMVNEFDDIKASWAEISTEDALTRTPDVLFAVGTDPASMDEVKTVLADSPAVRANRVYAVDSAQHEAGGISIIDQLEHVADSIAAG